MLNEWTDEKADRRVELIFIKHGRKHREWTDAESAEFETLQRQFGEYQNTICPLPTENAP